MDGAVRGQAAGLHRLREPGIGRGEGHQRVPENGAADAPDAGAWTRGTGPGVRQLGTLMHRSRRARRPRRGADPPAEGTRAQEQRGGHPPRGGRCGGLLQPAEHRNVRADDGRRGLRGARAAAARTRQAGGRIRRERVDGERTRGGMRRVQPHRQATRDDADGTEAQAAQATIERSGRAYGRRRREPERRRERCGRRCGRQGHDGEQGGRSPRRGIDGAQATGMDATWA